MIVHCIQTTVILPARRLNYKIPRKLAILNNGHSIYASIPLPSGGHYGGNDTIDRGYVAGYYIPVTLVLG